MPVFDARALLEASPEELAFMTSLLHPEKTPRQTGGRTGQTSPHGTMGGARGGQSPRIVGGHPLPRQESEAG